MLGGVNFDEDDADEHGEKSSPAEMTATAAPTTTASATATSEAERVRLAGVPASSARQRTALAWARRLVSRPAATAIRARLGRSFCDVPEPGGFEVPGVPEPGGSRYDRHDAASMHQSTATTIGGKTKPVLNTMARASASDFYANLSGSGSPLTTCHPGGHTLLIFTPDVRANDLRPIGRFVVPLVKYALNSEGLPSNTFG